ncbi:MAG: bifunctional UDP-N-acetylglucosamine diphosphorylase/glucosamine-1-phosphate N-acetyltransferase GlmU [Nitriliruptorales bacterium]|nr:bifunctional UDP-N-acetylglucosamine diphosphorylase/glucosamine-1-phosphate N-acetyltransferase GlmU [Nitriliruptorales bacterium]
MPRNVAAVILAAGQGTRFKSDLAKVLHAAAGRSMLGHILAAVRPLDLAQVVVVVGHQRDDVEAEAASFDLPDLTTVVQEDQLGTGHATEVALDALADDIDVVMVLPGDTPLLLADTLASLLDARDEADAALLSTVLDDPTGYGRVIRDGDRVVRIVEEADATDEQRSVREVNAGMYVFERAPLADALADLDADNAQGELYLTDVVEVLADDGADITTHVAPPDEVAGVNDRSQLAEAATVLRRRRLEQLMTDVGVTVLDPATTYIDVTVEVGRDSVILPNTILSGSTRLGERVTVGPNSRLVDTRVGDDAELTYAVAVEARVGDDCDVGPFSYLRPGTVLERGAKAGGFVEMKKAHVGEGSKVPHLSYIGDATIGTGVNVGAGTITCNYDGFDKHETIIEDDAFIGSDTMLVAPVRIGRGAVTGAGSAIAEDVPADALAVERSDQRNVDGWAKARREQRQ